jgi:hypothetical protein
VLKLMLSFLQGLGIDCLKSESHSRIQFTNHLFSKVKAELSLRLINYHGIKTYWGSGGIVPRIL